MPIPQVFIKSELKVGVVYVKEGQYTEEEILDNNESSQQFDEFLSILGERVRLKGTLAWDGPGVFFRSTSTSGLALSVAFLHISRQVRDTAEINQLSGSYLGGKIHQQLRTTPGCILGMGGTRFFLS